MKKPKMKRGYWEKILMQVFLATYILFLFISRILPYFRTFKSCLKNCMSDTNNCKAFSLSSTNVCSISISTIFTYYPKTSPSVTIWFIPNAVTVTPRDGKCNYLKFNETFSHHLSEIWNLHSCKLECRGTSPRRSILDIW